MGNQIKHCQSSNNFINRRASANHEIFKKDLLKNKSVSKYNNITVEATAKPYLRFAKKFQDIKKVESRNKRLSDKAQVFKFM